MLSNHLILHFSFPLFFSLSQHQGKIDFFQWDISSYQVGASALATVLLMNIQGWFPLGLTGLILQSKELSKVFSSTAIWKHRFFSAHPSLWSNSHIHSWLLEKPLLLYLHLSNLSLGFIFWIKLSLIILVLKIYLLYVVILFWIAFKKIYSKIIFPN